MYCRISILPFDQTHRFANKALFSVKFASSSSAPPVSLCQIETFSSCELTFCLQGVSILAVAAMRVEIRQAAHAATQHGSPHRGLLSVQHQGGPHELETIGGESDLCRRWRLRTIDFKLETMFLLTIAT
jgi:hypothetical protein